MSALTADEGQKARAVAFELSAEGHGAWFDELRRLSVAEAVAKIRALLSGKASASASASAAS